MQKLQGPIEKMNQAGGHFVNIQFVLAHNPVVNTFHNKDSFTEINARLRELGMAEIDWLPRRGLRRRAPSDLSTLNSCMSPFLCLVVVVVVVVDVCATGSLDFFGVVWLSFFFE